MQEIPLKYFGIQNSKPPTSRAPGIGFTVASGTSKWTWERNGSQLTINTINASLHDWSQCHRLNFRDSKSCKDWFSYLENYTSGGEYIYYLSEWKLGLIASSIFTPCRIPRSSIRHFHRRGHPLDAARARAWAHPNAHTSRLPLL
jgi:hypothetical protein